MMDLITQYGLLLLDIMFINIILSGDNALVIALASKDLPENHRKQAMWYGAGAAVILRIALSFIAIYLLNIPFIEAVGGILLVSIAIKLLLPQKDAEVKSAANRIEAIWTIVVADFIMSIDNVLAVAGAADGHKSLVAIGIAITIPLVLFASNTIMKAMEKWKWLVYLGSGVLGHTAGVMFAKDEYVNKVLNISKYSQLFGVIIGVIVIIIGYKASKKN